ncbi:hypothetical protein [Microvirga roseola]|uniref:hypothetical protein n=1 Tax=Microvirga roseola TaxID=2883126 RepID=UPI001E31E051|nr:hypothetical protein [Microvirga roseola]
MGTVLFAGSTTGSEGSTEIAASASDQPSRPMVALWMDRNSGVSAGAMLVLGALTWLGIAWGLAALLS